MPCSQLPLWVLVAQALAIPIFVGFTALFGTWVALRQMVIARKKLQLDEFYRQYDRRFAVYEATREFLASVYRGKDEDRISDSEIRAYTLCALSARFLFDENLYKYLHELCFHVTAWNHAASEMESSKSDDTRNEYRKIKESHSAWIRAQGDEATGFSARFEPFLSPPQRTWWGGWP